MAILNSWQRVDRVIQGRPWGDGINGSSTISSDPNTRATITGTATQTTGTAGSTAFANGDLVLLHQTQGTGAGQWEINMVSSGGGSTSLTFQVALQYTYGTGAQIIKIPRYTTATISGHSPTQWNGTTGSVEVICAQNSITASGVLNGSALGFRGGAATPSNASGNQGESSTGTGGVSTAANGMGGGGGNALSNNQRQGGGGGGYATSGANGGQIAGGASGTGGSSGGIDDLTSIFMGGAGGSGSGESGTDGGTAGGNSGAILILISNSITVSAGITSNGGNGGTNTNAGAGGGGAGGSVLGICGTATLGTNNITSTAGSGGDGASTADGGLGSVGRIAIHHSGTVTGTTNPTFTDVSDSTLIESIQNRGYFYFM